MILTFVSCQCLFLKYSQISTGLINVLQKRVISTTANTLRSSYELLREAMSYPRLISLPGYTATSVKMLLR